jgi:hypothetical protein
MLHRLDDLLRALALRLAEGREGEQGHPRLGAQAAGDVGRLDGDLGELLGGGVGISVMAVSATSTVRPRDSTIETPMSRWPGFTSMTRRTSSSAIE